MTSYRKNHLNGKHNNKKKISNIPCANEVRVYQVDGMKNHFDRDAKIQVKNSNAKGQR